MTGTTSQPQCFGTHLWSATHAQCVGGPDPGYTNPTNGSHTRDKCRWYQSCAQVSSRNRANNTQVIPVQHLIRPPIPQASSPLPAGVQPPPRPVAPPPQLSAKPPLQQAPAQSLYGHQYMQQQPQYQQAYPQAMNVAPPHVAQYGPQHIPVQVQMPGAQMPAYLTTPEPIDHEEGPSRALGRTLFRSAAKAIGHSLSSFFDHVPLKPHKPPPPPQ